VGIEIVMDKYIEYDINKIKQEVKLTDLLQNYISNMESKKMNKGRLYKDCPFCSHHWHFYITNNKHGSFSKCCESGTVIDFYSAMEGITFKEAVNRLGKDFIVKNDCDWNRNSRRIFEICKLLESYRERAMSELINLYFDWLKFIGDEERFKEYLPLNDMEKYQEAWNWRNENG
jgi:hypothetical protein